MADGSNASLAGTKLRPPVVPQRLVDRARLDAILEQACDAELPLVLVTAPAGSGKSTLVAGWAATFGGALAWLQLEESDGDAARFWVSLTSAIGRTLPDVANELAPVVQGSMGAATVVVPAVINLIASLDDRLVIVLDDYHLIDDPEVHSGVERLIDLCPPQLTVVLMTRADPPFRLGRMRVRGRVREIRSADLRFDVAEAAALLGAAGGSLDARRLADLCERTEGWAAGLVLAGLSLERTADAAEFVDSFRGDDQLIVGYLTDEFLAVLDEEERRRMIEAAVLHRLSGPLLDAVTGSRDGGRWLDNLATRNQLVVRLDTTGDWYRYHHLFRDVLLIEARRSIPDRLADLHRRAATWFASSAFPAAAVDHWISAGDRGEAMRLMRIVGPDLLGSGQLRTLRNILDRLAAGGELDAICLALSGWDHYLRGQYSQAQDLLDRATATRPDDIDAMRLMPLRINLALGRGDVTTALAGARAVVNEGNLEGQPSELITAVGAAFAWAGLADDARTTLEVALVRTNAERRLTAHAMALVAMSIVEFAAVDNDAARAAAERALTFATSSGLGEYHGVAPAVAIQVATSAPSATTMSAAEHAVALARRATTVLGQIFVLTVAADVVRRAGDDARGQSLLREGQALLDTCADAGINAALRGRFAETSRTAETPAAHAPHPDAQLSPRELAVLRYLPSPLSLPEIARELYVSPNTVKTQCSAIYRKLGVTNRQAAVLVAREQHLF